MIYPYDPKKGIEYARTYALYDTVPPERRLFYYDANDSDCANFASQCVWAAYGGWDPGTDLKTIEANRIRIAKHTGMAPYIWYGSASFSGSAAWCRVVEFYGYAAKAKNAGPQAQVVAEGDWNNVQPSLVWEGDLFQLIVQSYKPDQYGHSLYVTKSGVSWNEILICCHSFDCLDEPLSTFAKTPGDFRRFRVLRFRRSEFIT